MVQMTIEMPESALAALRKTPEDFARELRLAAAVKWYELRRGHHSARGDVGYRTGPGRRTVGRSTDLRLDDFAFRADRQGDSTAC